MIVVNTHHFTISMHGQGIASAVDMLAVLTQDDQGLFACYLGAWEAPSGADRSTGYEAKRKSVAVSIAHGGEKQSYSKALAYFPLMKPEQYRA